MDRDKTLRSSIEQPIYLLVVFIMYKITCLANIIANVEWCTTFEAQSSHTPNEKLYKNLIIKDDIVELKRNVASKTPAIVAWSKRCKIVYTTPANGYIQADDYMGRFINRIRWLKKWSKVFFCWDV